jgi:hypothetical protein
VLPALATHRAGLPWLLCGDLCAAGSGAACEIYMPGSGGARAVPSSLPVTVSSGSATWCPGPSPSRF